MSVFISIERKGACLSMSKKTIMLLVGAAGFLALTVLSTVFFVMSQSAAHASSGKPATVNLAFSGLITAGKQKGSAITGGLNEVIQTTGYFNGNLHLPDGTQISTSGKVDDKQISITFYNAMGAPEIKGVGQLTKAGDYVGTFKVYYKDDKVDSGIWSALPNTHPNPVTLAFAGQDIKGPDTGTLYYGALMFGKNSLDGTLNTPDGAVIPVAIHFGEDHLIHVTFTLSNGEKIQGVGAPFTKPSNGNLEGYKGSFYGPDAKDSGPWAAYLFSF